MPASAGAGISLVRAAAAARAPGTAAEFIAVIERERRGMTTSPRIDLDRLLGRLETFNRIGALPGGGNCRLALSDEDRAGRDLLVRWMRELGLAVTVDAIGNIIGVRGGRRGRRARDVRLAHRHGRNRRPLRRLYGVLAGLEACQALDDAAAVTRRPLALVAFTNEEGSRFPPYAMGSLVYVGGLALDDAYAIRGIDGATVGEELRRIGYVGDARPGWLKPHAYLELHIEQGPILENEGLVIGAVEGITGLAWTEVSITGRAAHAGTTPMHLRRDAAYAAGETALFVRRLAQEMGDNQSGTGRPYRALPEPRERRGGARGADDRSAQYRPKLGCRRRSNGLRAFSIAWPRRNRSRSRRAASHVSSRSCFRPRWCRWSKSTARELGLPCRRLPSGAGHDAQMMARLCPASMIFVPSVAGLSHNVREFTKPEHLAAGAAVLLHAALRLSR